MFFVLSALLLALIFWLPPDGFFSADSGPKFWQTLELAEGQGVPRSFVYPAADIDPERRNIPAFTAPVGDGLASIYPVLFPAMCAVPLALTGDLAIRWIPWLAGVLAAWCVGRTASRIRGHNVTGWVAAAALAATPLAFYSGAFWEHSLAALVVVFGFGVVLDRSPNDFRGAPSWMVLGLLLGLGFWIRTEVIFLGPLLMWPWLWQKNRAGLGRAAAGCGACGLGLAAGGLYQHIVLGRWLPLHVTYHAASSFQTHPFVPSRVESVLDFLSPHWTCGLAVVIWCAALALALADSRVSTGGWTLIAGIGAVLAALGAAVLVPLIRWFEGARPTDAFPYAAPTVTWIVLSALPVVVWGRYTDNRPDGRRLLLVVAASWLPVAVFLSRAIQSFEWGARIFLPTVLLLVAVMGSFTIGERRWHGVRHTVVATAVVAAVLIQALGLVLLTHGVTTHQRLAGEILRFTDPNEPVVTDAYMVPLVSGRGWYSRRFLYCTNRVAIRKLAARFENRGVSRWTYATVLEAPGERFDPGETVIGTDGHRWLRVDRLLRTVGSRTLQLHKYRREIPTVGES